MEPSPEEVSFNPHEALREWCDGIHGRKAELARACGVNSSNVSHWLARSLRPAPEHRATVERLTGIPADSWAPKRPASKPAPSAPPLTPTQRLDEAVEHLLGYAPIEPPTAPERKVLRSLLAVVNGFEELTPEEEAAVFSLAFKLNTLGWLAE